MTDLLLGDDDDLAVVDNDLVLISGGDEVEQGLRCNLTTFQGEWFLDESAGVPWFQTIFADGASDTLIAAALKRAILTTSGVLGLLDYDQSIDRSTRQLSVSFTAQATDGTIIDFSEGLPQ